ncbi:MAG: hypothetical protein EHM59_03505 [Betaproteobacteria bacterium]|nr:MAG: hypothetical protein EHM59_03505 [Betaproteobacteria bacterium]
MAYIGEAPVVAAEDRNAGAAARAAPSLRLPGLELEVTLDNTLRTYDTQVYFFVLPLSVDPRRVYPKNNVPGRTRLYVTVTPADPGFVFEPSQAVLAVTNRHFTGIAGYEFGMWDANGKHVTAGGKWDHRSVGARLALSEPGRRYYLSIDFDTPVPSPESPDISVDLSRALRAPQHPPIPLIRFAPVRWKDGYT